MLFAFLVLGAGDLQTEIFLDIDLIFGQGHLLHLSFLNLGFVRSENASPNARNMDLFIHSFFLDSILPFAFQPLVFSLLRNLFLLETVLEHAHFDCDRVPIGYIRILNELQDVVDVRLDFDQLLGGLWLVGPLRPVLVNQCPNLADLLGDLPILVRGHQILTAFGCLHLENVLFFADTAPSLHIFLDSRLQVVHFFSFFLLYALKLLSSHLCLLLVVLPLDDEAEVFLLEVCEVLVEVLRILEGQIVFLIGIIIFKQLLQFLRIFDLVLGS